MDLRKAFLPSVACLYLMSVSAASYAAENYLQARARLLASGLNPAPIPRGGEFDQCGNHREQALGWERPTRWS